MKPCKKCGATERYTDGRCLGCKRANDRRYLDNKRARERKERIKARSNWKKHVTSKPVKETPPGYHIRGTSTLRRGDGSIAMVWEKTAQDKDAQMRATIAAFEELAVSIPRAPIVSPPARCNDDLLCVYPLGDPHIGMLSWKNETGANFDLEIAERLLCSGIDNLVSQAPAAKTAILLNLGDNFHSNGANNRTPKSGHALDVDGRWPKVIRTGIRIKSRMIERLAERHEQVIVRMNPGNHDPEAAVWMAIALENRYRDNPRITIDPGERAHWFYPFGRCLIGSTHGDTKRRVEELHGIMSTDCSEAWARALYRRWYIGHVHHESSQEHYGTTAETFRTIAAGDAWHVGMGYRAGRDMRLDVWDRNFGWTNRVLANPVAMDAARELALAA